MRGVYYSACSLYYKTIAQFHQKCLLMRDCLLFRRLLLPESTVHINFSTAVDLIVDDMVVERPGFTVNFITHEQGYFTCLQIA